MARAPLRSVPPPRKARGVASRARRRSRRPTSRASCASASQRRRFRPGSKLRENELALEFGVPRTRVREALSVLEQRGLVERIPNRGAVVMRLELVARARTSTTCARCSRACARGWPRINGDRGSLGGGAGELQGADGEVRRRWRHRRLHRRIRGVSPRNDRRRRQPRAGRHARQHPRAHAGPDPPHHHPARPRRGRACSSTPRCSRRCAAATPTKPSGCGARTCAAPRPTSSATRSTSSSDARRHAIPAVTAAGPLAGYPRARAGLDRRRPVLRPAAGRLRRRGDQGRARRGRCRSHDGQAVRRQVALRGQHLPQQVADLARPAQARGQRARRRPRRRSATWWSRTSAPAGSRSGAWATTSCRRATRAS